MATRGMNKNVNTKGMKISYKEKAQSGKTVKKTVRKDVNPADSYKGMKDAFGNPVGGEGTRPPFTVKKTTVKKKAKGGGKMGKCKGGC